jgi:hypothetical protein
MVGVVGRIVATSLDKASSFTSLKVKPASVADNFALG